MAGTFLCPNTCGFAKVLAVEVARQISSSIVRDPGESSTKFQARLKQEVFKAYNTAFSDCREQFSIDFVKFHKKLPGLKEAFHKWNFRKANEKSRYLETFCKANWEKLSPTRKKEHCLANCKGCAVRYSEIQAYFPVKSNVLKAGAKRNPVFAAENEARKMKGKVNNKPTTANIQNAAKAIYAKVSTLFEKNFNISFAEALAKVPELNLQCKSANERRKERRHHYRHVKENLENQMEETAFSRYEISKTHS